MGSVQPWPCLTAVDRNVGSVNPSRPVREHERDNVRYLCRGAKPLIGEFVSFKVREAVWFLLSETIPPPTWEQDRAGTHSVDTDALWSQLPGQGAGKKDFGGFHRSIECSRAGLPRGNRGDGDGAASTDLLQSGYGGFDRSDCMKEIHFEGGHPI